MVDELLMAAQHRALRMRYPGECVWTLVRSGDHQFECELHVRRGSGDWLGMIYMDGWPLGGRLFMLRAEAVEWAATERLAFTDVPMTGKAIDSASASVRPTTEAVDGAAAVGAKNAPTAAWKTRRHVSHTAHRRTRT
jgi:hypothetical protein